MKKTIKAVIGAIILIGAISMAIVFTFGVTRGTVIETHSINYWGQWTWNYYTFDIYKYINNLQRSINPKLLLLLIPNFPILPTQPDWTNVISILNFLSKILAVFVPNLFIYMLNILLVFIKIILYPMNILFSLLGIDTQYQSYLQTFNTLTTLQIPLIPYW